jgi:hypothetical protein
MTTQTGTPTPAEREHWQRLAGEATPEPWKAERLGREIEIGSETWLGHLSVSCIHLGEAPNALEVADAKADAEFIAAARTAVPALLSALARAEARAGEAEDAACRGGVEPWTADYWLGRPTETGTLRAEIRALRSERDALAAKLGSITALAEDWRHFADKPWADMGEVILAMAALAATPSEPRTAGESHE